MRRPFLVFLLAILLQTAGAKSRATTPAAVPKDATPDGRRLFLDALHQLHSAQGVDLELQLHERTDPVEALSSRELQQAGTMAVDASESLQVVRPGKMVFEHRPVVAPGAMPLALHNVMNGSRLWVTGPGARRGQKHPPEGRSFDVTGFTAEQVMNSREFLMNVVDPRLRLLVDASAAPYFQNATGWKCQGGMDQGALVWRVSFDCGGAAPCRWEVWLSQETPHRMSRFIVNSTVTSALIILKPEAAHDPDALNDPKNMTSFDFKVRERVEGVFTRYELGSALPEDLFSPPVGPFKERPFAEAAPKYKIGDKVPLPGAETVAGVKVDPLRAHSVVVFDFWFAACGPCIVYTPKVEEVVAPFREKGVRLYGVNPVDSPGDISRALAKHGWKDFETIVDRDSQYRNLFSVSEFPTVVVVNGNGKLLYRACPGEPDALDRLRSVLQKATGESASASQPGQ